ncbi:MAG: HEAT repeat domain-containing protein [Pseudomonadota bacterium]
MALPPAKNIMPSFSKFRKAHLPTRPKSFKVARKKKKRVPTFGWVNKPQCGCNCLSSKRTVSTQKKKTAAKVSVNVQVARLIGKLSHKNATVRTKAVKELGRLGAKAKKAIPNLLKALHDSNSLVSKGARLALVEIAPQIFHNIFSLYDAIGNKKLEAKARRNAEVELMMRVRLNSAALAPLMATTLASSKNVSLRFYAAWVLEAIGDEAIHAAPALVVALNDVESKVRAPALSAVVNLGAKMLPFIKRVLVSRAWRERIAAAYGYYKICSKSKSACKNIVYDLSKLIADPEPIVARIAFVILHRLRTMGIAGKLNPNLIERCLKRSNLEKKYFAFMVLLLFAPQERYAAKLVKRTLNDPKVTFRAIVFRFSKRLKPLLPKSILYKTLLKSLRDKNWKVRIGAIVGLKSFKEEKRTIVPYMVRFLKDENRNIRIAAGWVLKNIDPKNKNLRAFKKREGIKRGTSLSFQFYRFPIVTLRRPSLIDDMEKSDDFRDLLRTMRAPSQKKKTTL